jgi:hypothetical protein
MEIPIKTLFYKESITNIQIDIFKSKVQFYNLTSDLVNTKSHAEILSGTQVYYDLKTDYEIISYIILLTDRESLDEAGKKTFDFYKNYDHKHFTAFEKETQSKTVGKPRCFAKFDGYGITHFQENSDGLWKLSQQRISDYFFYGTIIPAFPLSLRLDLNNKIISNISRNDSTFRLKGFPLLDYDKIPERSYSENLYNNAVFQTISISPKGVFSKIKSPPYETDFIYSIEDFRHNYATIALNWPELTIAEINAIIDAALVDTDFIETIHSGTNFQEPGEAPPN